MSNPFEYFNASDDDKPKKKGAPAKPAATQKPPPDSSGSSSDEDSVSLLGSTPEDACLYVIALTNIVLRTKYSLMKKIQRQ